MIADEAFTKVSDVDMSAAQSAAMINPKTPGDETTFVTATKTSFAAISTGNVAGATLAIALPIQPAFETTTAETGKTMRVLNATAFLPSLTLLAAIKRMIKP